MATFEDDIVLNLDENAKLSMKSHIVNVCRMSLYLDRFCVLVTSHRSERESSKQNCVPQGWWLRVRDVGAIVDGRRTGQSTKGCVGWRLV